jgi:hypothetical protein
MILCYPLFYHNQKKIRLEAQLGELWAVDRMWTVVYLWTVVFERLSEVVNRQIGVLS